MQTTTLKSKDRDYHIFCGEGLIPRFGRLFDIPPGKIAVITDSNVAPLYLDSLRTSLTDRQVLYYIIPAGEQHKTLQTCAEIYNFLQGNQFSRTDTLVALGGGVVGDITGFVAATFLRGVRYYGVPTSLLAQVDSSVGGKCGVDIEGGKNLVGAFYQPFGVVADTNAIKTLPQEQLDCGMAEVVKYAFIYDAPLLDRVMDMQNHSAEVINRCIEIKRDIVQQDEFDGGLRMILNFGHTIGHAAETLGNYTSFLHGQAVAAGMAYAAKLSVIMGCCTESTRDTVISSLKELGLPVSLPYTAEQLVPIILGDKKVREGSLNFILLKDIGKAQIVPVKTAEVGELVSRVLEE